MNSFLQIEGYAVEIFTAFGLDLNTPSTQDTPRSFIKAMFDATEGYDGDPKLVNPYPNCFIMLNICLLCKCSLTK